MILSKKLFALAMAIQLSMIGAANTFAAYNPADFSLPSSAVHMELSTLSENPLEQIILETMSNEDLSLPSELENIVKNNIFSFSIGYHQQDESEIFLMTFEISEADFATLNEAFSPNQSPVNHVYNIPDKDFYYAFKDNVFLASNIEGIVSDILMQSHYESLSDTESYKYFNTEAGDDNFLKIFVNFANIPEEDINVLKTIFNTEGIALKQLDNGFEAVVTLNTGENFPFDVEKYNFTPALYKKIPSENIIYYNETFNLAENLTDSLNILNSVDVDATFDPAEIFEEIDTMFVENLGFSFENDVLPLLKNRTALSIHSEYEHQTFPAITLTSEISNQQTVASQFLVNLNASILSALEKSFDEEYQQRASFLEGYNEYMRNNDENYVDKTIAPKEDFQEYFFNSTDTTVNNAKFYQININADANLYVDTVEELANNPKHIMTISTGITADGLLVITTRKDLNNLFTSNEGVNSLPSYQSFIGSNPVTGISYFDITNTIEYVRNIYNEEVPSGELDTYLDDFLNELSVLKNIKAKGMASGNNLSSRLVLTIDPLAMESIGTMLQEFFSEIGKSLLPAETLTRNYYQYDMNFSDVNEGDWYYYYVLDLAQNGIVKGYENNQFRPGQEITRAEFTKMVIETNNLLTMDDLVNDSSNFQMNFTDVEAGSWYSYYVRKASQLNLVNGYEDNSFRPNNYINRAEATAILMRLWHLNHGDAEMSPLKTTYFTDVQTNNWFYNPVREAYSLNLVSGKNSETFAPQDNLSRAEAATLLSRYMNLEN